MMFKFAGSVVIAVCVCAIVAGSASAQMEPGLQDKINKAIDKGVVWLKSTQLKEGADKDGWWGKGTANPYPGGSGETHKNKTGVAGLVLLALLECEVDPSDPVIVSGMDYVRRTLASSTDAPAGKAYNVTPYEVGVLLMMYDSYYDGLFEKACRQAKRDPRKEKRPPVKLLKEHETIVLTLVNMLKGAQTSNGGWRYAPIVTNPQGVNEDISATQIALLGLSSALRLGVAVSPDIFLKAAQFNLAAQQQDGPPAPSALSTSSDGKSTVMDKARGWAYANGSPDENEKNISGGMTACGVCSLILTKAALAKTKILTKEIAEKTDRGIFDGLAWINANYTVTSNPGRNRSHYYYLYGLERVGMLGGINSIGMHNWYIDGAKFLVGAQNAEGWWNGMGEPGPSDTIDTCFALLFLKKATMPVGVTLTK
jgi:hypothetical protein